jgi:hypothetical protein
MKEYLMTKQYHYVVSYKEGEGWAIDTDSEETRFPDGTIYDTEKNEWQFGYLGDGKFNGREQELTEQLMEILERGNK